MQVALTVRWLIVALGAVGVAYFVAEAVIALAGKTTSANILLNLLGELKVAVAISWGLTGAAVLYGRGQAKLRKETVERLTKRNQDLEQRIDANRTSSQLTPRGDTNPEDR